MRTPKSKRAQLPTPLSRAQAQAILAQAKTHTLIGVRNRAIMETFYRAGLRVGEVRALGEVDVDLEQNLLRVRHSKRDGSRNVPIDERLKVWLRMWVAMRRAHNIKPTEGTFFTGWKGRPVNYTDIQRAVKRYGERAGVQVRRLGPHTFRHTYATELLEDGFSLLDVQHLLGHTSIKSTTVYLHVRPARLIEKIRRRPGAKAEDAAREVSPDLATLLQDLADED